MSEIECGCCIRKAVCYTEEDKEGWCDKCASCSHMGCQNKIKFRMCWPVDCDGDQMTLCKDVCEEHSTQANDCSCSKSSSTYLIPYIYI